MGRTAKYSVEEIEAACQAVATAGRYSVGNVRQHLGGGGYAYLAPICQAWAERTASAARQPLDALVPEAFHRAVHGLVSVVREAGRQEGVDDVRRLRDELKESLLELAGRDAREAELEDVLKSERAQAAAAAEQYANEVAQVHGALADITASWKQAQALMVATETRATEADTQRQQLQASLDGERANQTKLLQKVSALQERCDGASRRVAELQQALQEEKQERIAATQKVQATNEAQLAAMRAQDRSR